MDVICKTCGKPEPSIRAGSITSYFFQHNYCRCKIEQENSGDRKNKAGGTTAINQICVNCGKSRPLEQKAGSFTGFLFKELRCQCAHPKFAISTDNFSRTGTRERIEQKRSQAKDILSKLVHEQSLAEISPGTIIGGTFKVNSVIGEGGMGVVYLATHIALQRVVALKVLRAGLTSEKLWLRFQSEAKILSALSHANLVKVYDLGIHAESVFYYSMDFLEGENLEDVLTREGALSLNRTIEIFLAVLEGLAYAHRNGIIHRDIKPANIFLCDDNEIKILDFGISKLTKADEIQQLTAVGEIFGSPYYMSPEQCNGEAVDARSDIYAVGCTMFETLSGFVPFEAKTAFEIALMHQENLPPILSAVTKTQTPLPQSIDYVIDKCLAKLPHDRYQSAKELALDLERIKEGKDIAHARRSASEAVAHTGEPVGARPALVPILAMVAVSACTVTALLFVWNTFTNSHSKAVAEHKFSKDVADLPMRDNLDSASLDFLGKGGEETNSSLIKDYLLSKPSDYSSVITVNGEKKKKFSFPKTFSLGEFDYGDTRPASGEIIIPADAPAMFTAGQATITRPELLQYFKADDLTTLRFGAVSGQKPDVVPYIAKLGSLTDLELLYVPLDKKNIEILSSLKKLRILDVELLPEAVEPMANSSILLQLQMLTLAHTKNVSPILRALKNSEVLWSLGLRDTTLASEDIDSICSVKNLTKLTLTNILLTDANLEQLTGAKQLTYLNLGQATKLTRACVHSIKKFDHLKTLVIAGDILEPSDDQELQRTMPKLVMVIL